MKAGQVEEKIEYLPVGDIHPSDNYRKSMDQAKLAELTESVKEQGVLQPITVRKNAKGYEIVYGERRWRAAKAAGLEKIPSMIRVLTDDQALEMAIIENDQREDPNPMDQAIGYKLLLDRGKHDAESLAAKLDHSRQYIEGRLRLLKLPPPVQEKLRDGSIPIGHALYLTRLRNEGDLKKVAQEVVSQDMSLNRLKEEVRRCSTEMSKAEFDTTACGSCPARSKSQVALFPDAKQDGDRCMDRSCFFTKTREHYKTLSVALRNMGVKVYGREQDFESALKKAGRAAIAIAVNDRDYNKPCPAKWKTECVKCEKRAFTWSERQGWQGKVLETRWACLNRACLNKMNKVKSKPAAESAGFTRPSSGRVSSRQHAQECRDRFLYREVAPKVEKSQALQLRLAIYYLLEHFDELSASLPWEKDKGQDERKTRSSIFKEITGRNLSTWFTSTDYAAIAGLPEKQLTEILLKVARASVKHTDPDVLLLMVPEAGIDLNKSLLIDKNYLNSKTKAELVKLAKALKLAAAKTIHDGMSKPAVVDLLLTQNLTGHLPKDLAGEFRLKELAALGGKKAKA